MKWLWMLFLSLNYNIKKMKKILIIIFIIISNFSFGQEMHAIATYNWNSSSEEFNNQILNDPKMDPATKKFIQNKMNKMFNKTFELRFDKWNSTYKEMEILDAKNQLPNSSWSPYGIDIALYKNIKSKSKIVNTDLMGKEFLVKDTLKNYNWKLENETKKIGGYLCHKAIAKTFIPDEKQDSTVHEKTNFFENIKKPNEIIIIAWYTEEILVNHGPEDYWGLPGLILEINDGKSAILCSKLILNVKENLKLDLPKKYKTISKIQFEELVKKKNKELEKIDFTKQ